MNTDFNEHISVDCVILGYDLKSLKVLLLERHLYKPKGKDLIFKDLTLPGNHIRNHEDLDSAAQRILFELTGLNDIYLEQFAVFSDPGRLNNPKDQQWLAAIGKDPLTSQIQNLYEVILGKPLDKRNFRKKLANLEFVVSLNEKQVGVAHKPARYYMFSRDVYERKKKEKFSLII
ncbi:MAG: NUDIX domain-containing protein [Bacteroidia bacterium]|nr:NUDIX domain-containing protein [Bacteroidia bacterium]